MKRVAAFSLIELLAVVALVGGMLALGVSAFQGTTAARLSGSSEVIGGLIAEARGSAFQRRQPTLLAIPTHGAYAYRATTLFSYDPAAPTGALWRQSTPWAFLPSPILFDPRNNVPDSVLSAGAPSPAGFPMQIRIGEETLNASQFCYIIFDSRGRPEATGVPRLRLIAGEHSATHPVTSATPMCDLLLPDTVRGVKYQFPH